MMAMDEHCKYIYMMILYRFLPGSQMYKHVKNNAIILRVFVYLQFKNANQP